MNTPQTAFQRATSRKLLIALGTLASVLTGVELTDRQALVVVVIACAYIFAEAAVDWQRARSGIAEAAHIELPPTPATPAVNPDESIEARARALLQHVDEGGTPTREHTDGMRDLLSANDSLRAGSTEGAER